MHYSLCSGSVDDVYFSSCNYIFSDKGPLCKEGLKTSFVSLVSHFSSATMCLREHIVLTRVEMDHTDDNSLDAYCNLKLVGSS